MTPRIEAMQHDRSRSVEAAIHEMRRDGLREKSESDTDPGSE